MLKSLLSIKKSQLLFGEYLMTTEKDVYFDSHTRMANTDVTLYALTRFYLQVVHECRRLMDAKILIVFMVEQC